MAVGYHHVEDVMGMAVSIDVRDDVTGVPGLPEVIAWLHHVDETYSVYRDDSPISRLGRGELVLDDVDDEIRDVLRRCEAIRHDTAIQSLSAGKRQVRAKSVDHRQGICWLLGHCFYLSNRTTWS